MNLPFYTNTRSIRRKPSDRYMEQKQAEVDSLWLNSTQNEFEVLMQQSIGSDVYNPVDISIDMAIDIGTGFKKSDDFKVFSHKVITTETANGLMYQYNNNYWITINSTRFASPTSSVEVRRCNNKIRWVNAQNGNVYEVPCVIDYELYSPSPQKDKDIVVANGHCSVICQGNDTTRLLEKNQRVIFNGMPFKLAAINALNNDDINTTEATLMYLDFYLDIEEPTDGLVDDIANEGEYPVPDTNANRISINPITRVVRKGETVSFTATLYLNNAPQQDVVNYTTSGASMDSYTLTKNGNVFTLTGNKISETPLTLTLSAQNVTKQFVIYLSAYF